MDEHKEHIFISYAHANLEQCLSLVEWLQTNASHLSIWMDNDKLPLCGDLLNSDNSFNNIIKCAINNCKCLIHIWTKESAGSYYAQKELEYAAQIGKRLLVLKLDASLDERTKDLAGGVLTAGKNLARAWNEQLYYEALDKFKIEEYKEYGLTDSLSDEEMRRDLSNYAGNNRQDVFFHTLSSRIVDSAGTRIKIENIKERLKKGERFQLIGERGTGRTSILKSIFNSLLDDIDSAIKFDSDNIYIPVYFSVEELWNTSVPISTSNLVNKFCIIGGAPYSNNKKYVYVFLVDGSSAYRNLGRIHDAIGSIIRSNGVALIVANENVMVMPTTVNNVFIELYGFNDIRKVVESTLNIPSKICDFFYKLLSPVFKYSPIENDSLSGRDLYLLIIGIYEKFRAAGRANDFYSVVLAKSTENKRLPDTLTANEIEIWKRIIKRNEVFSLLRYPVFLFYALKIYQKEPSQFFSCQKNIFFYSVYRHVIDELTIISADSCVIMCDTVLSKLYELIVANNSASIGKEELRKAIAGYNFGDFSEIIDNLCSVGLIKEIGNDVTFLHRFIYTIFEERYKSGHDIANAANALRVEKNNVEEKFFALAEIKTLPPYSETYIDTLEMAVQIYLDGLLCDKRDLQTDLNKSKIQRIVAEKLELIQNGRNDKFFAIASIKRALGRLSGLIPNSIDCTNNTDVANSDYWVEVYDDNGCRYLLSKYLVTYSDYKQFVDANCEGYKNKRFWVDEQASVIMPNGDVRDKPLDADEGGYPLYNISNHPIVGITWFEAYAFCKWYENNIKGYEVVLPSVSIYKSVYEKSCSQVCNAQNSLRFNRTTPVDLFTPDPCCDIIGNAWEWCSDSYNFDEDLIGNCFGGAWNCQITQNNVTTYPAHLSSNNIGFRLMIKEKKNVN